MKLYYSVQRTGDPNSADPWQIPGKQDKKAERVDVPGSPAELSAWLNARRVPLAGDAFDGLVPCNEPARELLAGLRADAGGAVLSAEEVDRVNDTRPGFLPRLSAEEIERHRMAAAQCPKCGNTRSYLHALERVEVETWIENAGDDALDAIAEKVAEEIAARRAQ